MTIPRPWPPGRSCYAVTPTIDHDLRNLYLLRDELCLSVERGSIGFIEAAERFERARERLIQKWQQQNQYREEGAVGAG